VRVVAPVTRCGERIVIVVQAEPCVAREVPEVIVVISLVVVILVAMHVCRAHREP
jgi:hypothetical protein